MNTPNAITLGRIALIPLFVVAMELGGGAPWNQWRLVALVLFICASSTDWMDGYIARKRNQVTDFGKFIDPLADKLLVGAALLYFVGEGTVAAWCALLIIAREFIISSLRMVAADKGVVIAAGFSGKVKTLVQIFMIIVILSPVSANGLGGGVRICDAASWLMTAVTLWSGVVYIWNYRGILQSSLK